MHQAIDTPEIGDSAHANYHMDDPVGDPHSSEAPTQ